LERAQLFPSDEAWENEWHQVSAGLSDHAGHYQGTWPTGRPVV
jgi:hypothetical protein